VDGAVRYLESRQLASGGFAEPAGERGAGLTAWAVLALRAARVEPSAATRAYLAGARPPTASDLALVTLATAATGGGDVTERVRSLRALQRPSGSIGPTINSTAWGVLALRQARVPVARATTRWLLARQHASGGWSWAARGAPDSNDTAAVVQALVATGVRGRPVTRALAFLRRHRNRDGGFELTDGRGSDTQSTAWAIQAFLAAKRPVPRGATAYLLRMRRADGSLRYSARYVTTPVWVTAQALPALARKPFPLR
jgi:hypothetical protein